MRKKYNYLAFWPHPCGVPACRTNAHNWSQYCAVHALHNRQRGSPTQRAITPQEIRRYEERFAYFFFRTDRPSRAKIKDMAATMHQHLMAVASDQANGILPEGKRNMFARQAGQRLLMIKDVDPLLVLKRAWALHALWKERDRFFDTPLAFRFALALWLRRLNPTGDTMRWDSKRERYFNRHKPLGVWVGPFIGAWCFDCTTNLCQSLYRAERAAANQWLVEEAEADRLADGLVKRSKKKEKRITTRNGKRVGTTHAEIAAKIAESAARKKAKMAVPSTRPLAHLLSSREES